MEFLTDPNAWIALLTLTVLQIVLGIDNIVFISVLTSRLPKAEQARGRQIGLAVAMVTRIGLLLALSWVIGLTEPLLTIAGFEFTGRDVILLGGGVFLLAKATTEIHAALEGDAPDHAGTARAASFGAVIFQIGLVDIVFSLDSVITAVGMADDIAVMVISIVVATVVMLVASGPLARFIEVHPTVKMLALSFLLLIGFSLVAEGFGVEIPKGYVYFAMGFSVFVEMLNLRLRPRHSPPLHLRPYPDEQGAAPSQ
jgi:predicted tellurium resistance membrane protein TerC